MEVWAPNRFSSGLDENLYLSLFISIVIPVTANNINNVYEKNVVLIWPLLPDIPAIRHGSTPKLYHFLDNKN